jgi:hypothetical protein
MSTPPVERPQRPTARDYQVLMRNRLIDSRLTPNAISLTGLALCIVAAVLVWNEYFFLGGIAFIVGSVCDTLDGRYSRMSGKGTSFGAFLDSTLDRMEEPRPARAGRVRAGGAVDDHRLPAHLARPQGADARSRAGLRFVTRPIDRCSN